MKKDAKPGQLDFDYSDLSIGAANSSVSIASPMGLYWIGVFAFQKCVYQLHVEAGADNDCEHGCSGHGTCLAGLCKCTGKFFCCCCAVCGLSLTDTWLLQRLGAETTAPFR